ncbi:uncharacterized protein T551_00391 [Pneumocystis jirovecii RU7]|uniref:Uncharacterized protein n=1 Tax=Pneumocystis jirovecii (strain RU7) TaxID=1408657 RepID=A0A0W4ZVA6_PNEJ7|nr:uncharacterized protein T551_00391 [Pneumocystis jirovecii RU7]KTW32300.1 hypothetical protein T551_00391 [Pneumocystis jirovecii RU7]
MPLYSVLLCSYYILYTCACANKLIYTLFKPLIYTLIKSVDLYMQQLNLYMVEALYAVIKPMCAAVNTVCAV